MPQKTGIGRCALFKHIDDVGLLCATRAGETVYSDQWSINHLPDNSQSGTITATSSLRNLDADHKRGDNSLVIALGHPGMPQPSLDVTAWANF
ncbi:MAG: hypothetical protein HQK55_10055 [Deltaproteobacteria bacterium]|nr:hypothetical protein [Deltaproteobacteria bacterium]